MTQPGARCAAILFAVAVLPVSLCAGSDTPVATEPASRPSAVPSAPPSTQPSTTAGSAQAKPLISFGSVTIPIELPTLSGTLVDQFAFTFHGQATSITQGHGDFPAKYSGPHSQTDDSDVETSWTGTLFTGIRLMPGTEIYFNPEVDAGSGIGHVLGIGDFPNGEISHVTTPDPSPQVARLFLRQTFGFGGEQEDIPDGQNQIAEKQDINRLTVTVGKYASSDIFDNNTYAHDARAQFMNLGLIDNTAWDYPADTRGYIEGLSLELNGHDSTVRYGIFREPKRANGEQLDDRWDRAFGQVVEYEQRFTLFGHPGAIRPMGYLNFANMGSYREALDDMPVDPNVIATRSYSHKKYGVGVSAEQEITSDLGIFARLGWANGQSEEWAFTEVDRMASLGLSLKGASWGRPDDVVGLGGVIAGLGKDHRDYLAAGGIGGFLGDGRLSYAPEQVVEIYYLVGLTKNIFLTGDYQFIDHPGFNSDRGPISVGSFRFHFEF
jgi:high affinity Mn2+ porin